MKILIADFDLFQKTGGGQAFYRSIIEKNPSIDFYYLTYLEKQSTVRSPNAHPIPYQEEYSLKGFHDLNPPYWVYPVFVTTNNIAFSVSNRDFDIVDVPDYQQFGMFLGPALRHHGVSFQRLLLSMHGRLSTSIRLGWSPQRALSLELQEVMQYKAVDIRYGISKSYIEEWRGIAGLKAEYLDPTSFIPFPKPTLGEFIEDSPTLTFIGRPEKLKGPDILVDLAWWLPPGSFSSLKIIGPPCYDSCGVSSSTYLSKIAEYRTPVQISPAMNPSELSRVFCSKTIVCLPSRYDTFNLIALESLFAGCPTVIGSRAGVIGFLNEHFSKVPFITLDVSDIYSCLPAMRNALQHYERYRYELVTALENCKIAASENWLNKIYNSSPHHDKIVRDELERWYEQLTKLLVTKSVGRKFKSGAVKWIKAHTSVASRNKTKKALKWFANLRRLYVKLWLKQLILAIDQVDGMRVIEQALKACYLGTIYREIHVSSESTDKDVNEKLQRCWALAAASRIDRVRIWSEIARLEQSRGNSLLATTYDLRIMRALGYDHFGKFRSTVDTLEANGFESEARVVEAMYGPFQDKDLRCERLLRQAIEKTPDCKNWEYEIVDDRRSSVSYRASVIVSLYNCADKLRLFLSTLNHQTMIGRGAAEVILIDSGSPGEEYKAFKHIADSLKFPIIYARSKNRETIQSAWNRGIGLARSPYLTFLGVDEAILPDCLDVLTAELDRDPTLDWVIGNSLVTKVDKNGTYIEDIMLYDRTGYTQNLVYLETAYLSWVGALYRKSLHDRFGFYDSTFSAAGDTEFKNRILPFIKTKAIPRTLGIFRNYPDERTTESPRAEIEDLRAWYLHRTVGGLRYAFSERDPQDAVELLYAALGYRKSYRNHLSTDVEYASNVADFMLKVRPDCEALKLREGILQLLQAYRSLDYVKTLSKVGVVSSVLRTAKIANRVEQDHRKIITARPGYKIFNDNRHEQHCYTWKSTI